ncbi:MAG: alkaline phosphatase [Acidobacteria bacterium]|nr:alkaline phosphatase [Acidobacteriota bacterium]
MNLVEFPLRSRRELFALGLSSAVYSAATPGETHQASGVKVGEMTSESALVWTRRTAASIRNNAGVAVKGRTRVAMNIDSTDNLEGSAKGTSGWMRVRYKGPGVSASSKWAEVLPGADFTAQVPVTGLRAASSYEYVVETKATHSGRLDGELTGTFKTLPAAKADAPAKIALLSCQMYADTDQPGGFHIYDSIRKLKTDFLLGCGDNVYYDGEDPIANTEALANYHWQRMFSLPSIVECLRSTGGYWQKDDHDLLDNDVWPTRTKNTTSPLAFQTGQRIFRSQVPAPPAGKPMYRTVRAGAHVELWLPEVRDYRSANTDPDGPAKTIWGAGQKRWLMESLKASNATWKILVNPNPIVGPDRPNKSDNHANAVFAHEGSEFRNFLKNNFGGNVVSVCGDRHWQYHSVDPQTGVHEFGCGAASDSHAGGSPGYVKAMHRFHRQLGGFLTMEVPAGGASLRLVHRDVMGAEVHSHSFPRKA